MLLGFGVSEPKHVAQARAMGANGVIVGSAIGKIIEDNLAEKTKLLDSLKAYAAGMKAATTL